jgi:hypothetical protein
MPDQQLDGPLVELTDSRTGQTYSPDDILANMSDADLKSIADEMKRRCNLMLLPWSLFYKGSEFRQFVADFTAQHGTAPEFFSIGDREMAIPEYWPDDPIYEIKPADWGGRFMRKGSLLRKDGEIRDEEKRQTCTVCGKMM